MHSKSKGVFFLQQTHPYGSAFRRFFAFLIDSLLLAALSAIIGLFFGAPAVPDKEVLQQAVPGNITDAFLQSLQRSSSAQQGVRSYLEMAAHLLYWPLFESSAWQATPGKRILRLCVADLNGNRISFARALARNLSKVFSVITLGFGFLMIAVTVRNQCLHDKIAGTMILKRTDK